MNCINRPACNSFIYSDLHTFSGSTGEAMVQKILICEALLKAGALVNATDKWNRTPLHYCVSSNPGNADASTAMEELLLENKADLFMKCSLSRTPLHYAFDKVEM